MRQIVDVYNWTLVCINICGQFLKQFYVICGAISQNSREKNLVLTVFIHSRFCKQIHKHTSARLKDARIIRNLRGQGYQSKQTISSIEIIG